MRRKKSLALTLLLAALPLSAGLCQVNSNENNALVFTVNNTEYMRISGTSGNVGIGTTAPGEKLHVNSGPAEFALQWDSTGSKAWVLGSATNRGYIRNKSDNLEPLTILNSGNVGISKTAPIAKLDVNGTISASDAVQVGASSLTCSASIGGALRYSGGNIQFCNGSAWTPVTTGGTTGAGAANHIAYWNSASGLTYDNAQLYWDATKNWLGIGTSTPGTNLSVTGSISASTNVTAGGYVNATTLRASDGDTAAAPGHTWAADTNTGMFHPANDVIGFSINGTERTRLTSAGVSTTGVVYGAAGSAAAPTYTFGADTNTGAFNAAADIVGVSTGGTERLRVASGGVSVTGYVSVSSYVDIGTQALGNSGDTAAAPSFSWTGDTNVGMYRPAADTIGLTTNGAERLRVNTSLVTMALPLQVTGNISSTSAIQVGSSALTCTAGIPGAIRYNAGALEFCNGSAWTPVTTGGTTGAGAANHIAYWNSASGLTYDNAQLYWDATKNWLGIGTSTPGTNLSVAGSISASTNVTAGGYVNATTLRASDGDTAAAPGHTWAADTNTGMFHPANDVIGFSINGTERMRTTSLGVSVTGYISVSGIVDIGTQALGNSGDTAAAPSFSWTGDTNVGMFRPTTDAIGLSTNGAERLRVDASGNVGIGTSAPAVPLEISGSAALRISQLGGTNNPYIEWRRSNVRQAYMGYGAPGTSFYVTMENGNRLNIIASDTYVSGDLGVGTVSPAAKLQVAAGNILIDNTYNLAAKDTGGTSQAVLIGRYSNNATYLDGGTGGLYLRTNNGASTGLYINSAGTVDLGSSAVTGSAGTVLDANGGWVRTYGTSGWYNGTYLGGWHMSDTTWVRTYNNKSVYTAGVMRADGGFTDQDALTLSHDGYHASYINTTGSTLFYNNSGSPLAYRFHQSGGASALDINDSGDVGIGTAPGYRLHVADDAASYVAFLQNTNTATSADGLVIRSGPATNPGSGNSYILLQDGDGTTIGNVTGNGAGGTTYGTTSDRRIKANIEDTRMGLDDLMMIKVRDYNPKDTPHKVVTGYVAQELYEVFPDAVSKPEDEAKQYWSVDYGRVTPLIVKAVQDLKAENDNLRAELKSANDNYDARLRVLEQKFMSR